MQKRICIFMYVYVYLCVYKFDYEVFKIANKTAKIQI